MFIHNLKYAIKALFRNKMLIFWTFAFPIILGTFFSMAFSNIEKNEKLDTIDIAIIDNEDFKNNKVFSSVFTFLDKEENDEGLFNIKYVNEDEAKKLLENGEITGYMKLEGETPKIVVTTSGINETVFKYVTEEITQNSEIAKTMGYFEYAKSMNVNIENISNKNLSYTMIEYYTLIAMACLYGGILGMVAINKNLPNMTNTGKRIAASPINKFKIILSSSLAGYLTQIVGLAILFIYTIFVLHVDYGDNLLLVISLALAGAFAGLSLGTFLATIFKANDGMKTGIVIAVTMFGCFLSGMMGITMKYVIDKNIPIVNKLNPASMITDGFYSLYYYDTLDRFIFNFTSLLIFSFVLIAISCISLRRQKYDSI